MRKSRYVKVNNLLLVLHLSCYSSAAWTPSPEKET
jgi:hypothetical protein